ncbi:MAG: hypothetical protein H6718_10530 [Polyangiaceae bacterium]|nr:hypothetical protein [Polyangiaceae bacterium]MCB9607243.1 hypothetical protein [Polyangiaceae bacterium]
MESEVEPQSSRAPAVRLEAEGASQRLPTAVIRVLVPGIYAWIVTVALPSAQRDASALPKISAFFALVCLIGGPIVALYRERVGRAMGVYGFVGFAVITWLVLGDLLSGAKLDPVRAALGSVGWALFAFGWGSVREVGAIPEQDPHALTGAPLTARSTLPKGAGIVMGLGLAGAVVPIFLAWRIDRPLHALLGHAVAVVVAVALVTSAALVGVSRGNTRQHSPRTRLELASRSLGLAVALLSLGFMAAMLW